jgi:tetratricopeptide (TPR) repeat protein
MQTNYLLPLLAIIFNCMALQSSPAQSLQDQPLDSLLNELPKAKDDTSKAKTFYGLAVALASNDNTASLNYANKCMNVSKQARWTKGIGLACYAFAKAYYEITNYTLSMQNGLRAFEIFKSLNDKKNMAVTLKMIGVIYERLGYYPKALESHFAALRLFEAINDKRDIGTCNNNIGNVYYRNADYDKALEMYKNAFTDYKELNDKYGVASALDNIASIFIEKKNYDSANVYNLQAIKIFEEIKYQPDLGRVYYNRGNLLRKLHDAKSAYEYYMRAVEIDKRLGIKIELADDYGAIGNLYLHLAKDSDVKYIVSPLFETDKKSLLQKAQFYYKKALVLSKEEDDLFLIMDYAGVSSETEERLGNYRKALALYKEHKLYNDSIYNDENRKKIATLETQRLTEVKDKEIQLLNKDKALQASEIKWQTLIKNIIIVTVVAAAIFTFFFVRSFNRRRKTAFDKQVMEVEMKALRAQMNPHFIFNSLHSINKYVIENDKENASAYLSKFSKLMRLILENSREQEVPLENDLCALELYMQLESLRFKNRFTYIIETDPGIDKENTLIPPLMLQPFVENAIIHGMQNKESGLIRISVTKENTMIKCAVEDNGMGRWDVDVMKKDGDKKRKSLGIKIINERLSIINQLKKAKAAINIFDLRDAENKPGGLRIELLLPLQLAF